MSGYKIYKISSFGDKYVGFYITYSRQYLSARLPTIRRNAKIGVKGKMYDFVRKVGVYLDADTLYDENTGYDYDLSLEAVKKESYRVKERERVKAIDKVNEKIVFLKDDITELKNTNNSKAKDCVAENIKKIKDLEENIIVLQKL